MKCLSFLTQCSRFRNSEWLMPLLYLTFHRKKNKNPTWPWVFHELDSIFLKLKISRIFSRVIICQLALLFVIVLLFLCDSGKAVVATSFKTKKRSAYWAKIHYNQSFYLHCTDIIRNFADLWTPQLDKKKKAPILIVHNFDQFSVFTITSSMSKYDSNILHIFETSPCLSIKESCFLFFWL